MLTVTEAARVLRIGRTLAYKLATDFLETGEGLPVVRLGGCLRVPRESLRALMRPTEPSTAVTVAPAPLARSRSSRAAAGQSSLPSLFEHSPR